MRTKHYFVPVLDIGELLPFAVKPTADLQASFKNQEIAKKELDKFVGNLEKKLKQKIFYMGVDVIGEKSYERFILDKGGFLEVMVENPIAMNAHFVHEDQAKKFKIALLKTLEAMMPKGSITDMFINSIEVQNENDDSLTVEGWNKLKKVRES